MRITFISDTHTKHDKMTQDLPGGDLIIHAGDSTSRGYRHEINQFVEWFDKLYQYDHKIFIAGNHDWGFQDNPKDTAKKLAEHPGITYLQDESLYFAESGVKVYGSPWQPEFNNWSYNLARGLPLREKWNLIPERTNYLITHGPPYGILDWCDNGNVGCEELRKKVDSLMRRPNRPLKYHVFGHIHESHGSLGKVFHNISICDGDYRATGKPKLLKL